MFKKNVLIIFLLFNIYQISYSDPLKDNLFLDKNLASFDYVWTTIRDKYYDPNLGGHDWQAIYDTLKPKVETAESMDDVRNVLRTMLGVFGESHFAIIPSEIYSNLDFKGDTLVHDRKKLDFSGSPGFDVRLLNGEIIVTSVLSESPASKAGIKTGWMLQQIDEDTLTQILPKLLEQFDGNPMQDLILYANVKYKLMGAIGDSVQLQFLDENNKLEQKKLVRIQQKGKPYQFGYLPEVYVWMDVDTLKSNVGYVAFNGFMDPVRLMPKYNQAIQSFMNVQSPGVIIDLRGNTGGIGAMAMGMAGWFVKEKNQYLGTLTIRGNDLKIIVNNRPEQYLGKVAILVDALSASSSEFLAGGLQDLGCATIIGTRTAAAALPSAIERLPNGDGFQYVFANYVSAGGQKLEGRGVIPDIKVKLDRGSLLQGRDLVLEKAIEWILNNE